MNTVFPTPAPPNKPIFPPFAYGSIKSITLIPVYKTSVEVERFSNLGGVLCIGYDFSFLTGSIPSIVCPITLKSLPLISSPTGIEIGSPRFSTTKPRCKPSVESIAIVLTVFSPMSCWHSNINSLPSCFTTRKAS